MFKVVVSLPFRRLMLSSFIVLIYTAWSFTATGTAQASSDPCEFTQMDAAQIMLTDGQGGKQYTTPLSDEMRQALSELKGFGIWKSGEDGAYGDFTVPHDTHTVAWIVLTSQNDLTRWLWLAESPSMPGHVYAWVFTSLQATRDRQGNHLGQHQTCATVDVPLDHVQALLAVPNIEIDQSTTIA